MGSQESATKISSKYWRLLGDAAVPDYSTLGCLVHGRTGFYPNDYINPVTAFYLYPKPHLGDVIQVLSDESVFNNQICCSLVAYGFLEKSKLDEVESALEELVHNYDIDGIHMTDIFGRKKVLKGQEEKFFNEYIKIVNEVPGKLALSHSVDKDIFFKDYRFEADSEEDVFFVLFWECFDRFMSAFPDSGIFHLSFEQRQNIHQMTDNNKCQEVYRQLGSGISQICQQRRHISILRHPNFHTKKALLYSSLADISAYVSNKIQEKIDKKISDKKLINNHKLILQVYGRIFQNHSGDIEEFKNLIRIVREG